MKMLRVLLIAIPMFFSTTVIAGQYQHLIDGSIDLSSLRTDSDATSGSTKDNYFEFIVKYRNQVKDSLYLVTGFQFISSEIIDSFGFDIGIEKDFYSFSDNVEIGPGIVATFTDGEYGTQDYRSFGFTPYAFIRSFIGGSQAYVMWTVGYQFAFADRDGTDEDTRGFTMSFGFGLGF